MKVISLIRSVVFFLLIMSFNQPGLSQKKIANYPKDIIYFGQGGGFAGIETTYALLESGDLYKKQSLNDAEYTFIKRLPTGETKQIFSNYAFLGIPAMQLNQPANTYQFIEYADKASRQKLVWGGAEDVPGNLKLYYSLLKHIVTTTDKKKI